MELKVTGGYTYIEGDRSIEEVPRGKLTEEAVRRLSLRPEIIRRLQVFDDMWGLDCYDPFDDDACSEVVVQLVKCALLDVAAINERGEE